MNIRPIETEFDGYRFRSRLEARWAMFFKALEIPYEYEPEGFECEGVRYLPDFYLPEQKQWLEMKPECPERGSIDEAKHVMLAQWAKERDEQVFVIVGTPTQLVGKEVRGGFSMIGDHMLVFPKGYGLHGHGWGECGCAEKHYGLRFIWREVFLHQEKHPERGACSNIRFDTPNLRRAYEAARSARFERYPKNMRRILMNGGRI